MKLEEKLISLSEYGIEFKTYKNNFIIAITYHDGWSIIKPSDEKIKFIRDNKKPNTYYYATEVSADRTHLEGIFATIDETINYNKELEEKMILLKEKIDELSKLFVDKPISELRRLEFKIPQQKKSTSTKKKKEETIRKEEKEEETSIKEIERIDSEIDKKIKLSVEKVKNKNKKEIK